MPEMLDWKKGRTGREVSGWGPAVGPRTSAAHVPSHGRPMITTARGIPVHRRIYLLSRVRRRNAQGTRRGCMYYYYFTRTAVLRRQAPGGVSGSQISQGHRSVCGAMMMMMPQMIDECGAQSTRLPLGAVVDREHAKAV